jgi:hypothetical protein
MASWRNNPQYLLDLPAGGDVFISLTQPALFGPIAVRKYLAVGLCVLRGGGSGGGRRRILVVKREQLLATSPISDTRELSISLTLPPSAPDCPHVIVPYTYEPGEVGGFKLCCWSAVPFTLNALAPRGDWKHTSATAEWAHSSAGGCPNPENPGWHGNPQWELQVRVPTTVHLILELRPAPPPEAPPQFALGCLVLHSHAAAGRKLQMTSDDVVAKAGLLR